MINIFQLNKQIIYLSLITIKSELNFISLIKILLTRSFFIKSSMNTNMINNKTILFVFLLLLAQYAYSVNLKYPVSIYLDDPDFISMLAHNNS